MLTVAAYTKGVDVPSARFRVRQYIPHLRRFGVHLDEYYPRAGGYPPPGRWRRAFWAAATLAERVPAVALSYRHDLTLLQREMLSTFLTLEPLAREPRLLDVDDAIWLRRGGEFAARLARLCEAVICGNSFVADHFARWNRNVVLLPTAVDTDRFVPSPAETAREGPIICWSGTSGCFEYLYLIEEPLRRVLAGRPGCRLRIVSDCRPSFKTIPATAIDFVQWSADTEVSAIQHADVGIMPMDDSAWARGKCSYKMLTYMSCGIPVVATPVGMNAAVYSQGEVGIAAMRSEEWVEALNFVLTSPGKAAQMGKAGRALVLERYSIHALAPLFAHALHKYSQ